MDHDELQLAVIATCREHKEQNRRNTDYRACGVYIGKDYIVKYGAPRDLEPERRTQEYILTHAHQSNTSDAPRIARIIHHFVDQITMYLVMERIELQESPPDLDARIEKAVKWLSEVPLPSNPTLGPVGGGPIRHKFFQEFEAPFEIPNVEMLDVYIKKARGFLSVTARKQVSPVSVCGERLMFAQSDLDDSNFGVDEHGRTVLMNFNEIGVLPETFVVFTYKKRIAASLGLSRTSNGYSMAAIAHVLWMVADPTLGMSTGRSKKMMEGILGSDVCSRDLQAKPSLVSSPVRAS